MKIFKNLFIIFVFINAYNFAHAQKIDLGSFNTTMLEIDKEKEVIQKFKSEFEFYNTLKEIKDIITQEELDNNMLSDVLVIIDSLSNIENTFPKTVKIKFEKDFLVGANLTISDLKNASFFLNSLNKQKVQNLNKSIDLISSKKIIQLSKIQRTVFQNFNVNPRILISELESMPEIDLIGLSSSIENTTSELSKNISSLSENIENASNEVDKMTEKINSVSSSISFAVGASISIAASNLDQAAEMIANTISSGVAVDLEAASQGMGFDSFADAVNAYNEQYGTNYTVDSAKEALGQ